MTCLVLLGTGASFYIGPGPGLSLTWALIGLLLTVATALGAVLMWPVRRLLRRLRGRQTPSGAHVEAGAALPGAGPEPDA